MDLSSVEFWITLLTQIGIMLVIFLVNFFMLSNLVFKPTLKILAARHKKLSGLSQETKKLEERINRKWNEYEGLLEESRQVARMAREDILKTAETEKQNIVTQARTKAEAQMTQARETIRKETESARVDLKAKVKDLANDIVAKILGQKAA